MSDQINKKDADQDQTLALLTHRIEDSENETKELKERVRTLRKKFGVQVRSSALL